ncbi:MAG TPA: flotillin family protein, partial [Verrucomicrobiae bacterium]
QTAIADIQQQVVGAEQGVNIAELSAGASVKHAAGEAESTRLRALGEADAIRATGQAKAAAYSAGVQSLGAQGYTVMQLMQIVGERNVRIVPDVAVSGNGGNGMVDGLLGMMLRHQTETNGAAKEK